MHNIRLLNTFGATYEMMLKNYYSNHIVFEPIVDGECNELKYTKMENEHFQKVDFQKMVFVLVLSQNQATESNGSLWSFYCFELCRPGLQYLENHFGKSI